ncbi:pyruvate carboxylase subunit B [Virgibacillus natechei]|uniref:pyruvate carboxylase subunit B n=1 Tax=Virgibacillus sp. CBA3643 TaxID=2942278 RepID=UPI0035A3613F
MKFVDETLRDSHQSLWATRMKTKSMLPIAKTIDEAGFDGVMVGGGAIFEACIKFLNENPWERFKLLKQLMPNSSLGFLLRGRGLFAWDIYPDDVVRLTVQRLEKNGISWLTVFDALNDVDNMKCAIQEAKKVGMQVNGGLMFTVSPVHTDEYFANKAQEFIESGSDVILINDSSGLLTAERTKSLIRAIRKKIGQVEIKFHAHGSTGLATESYHAAIDSGVNMIDTLTAPLSQGYSLPATSEMLDYVYRSGKNGGLKEKNVQMIDDYIRWVAYKENKPLSQQIEFDQQYYDRFVEHQVPGGMMSNLENQLRELGVEHRLPEVLEEAGRVRKELGYPVMVTPLSQIVGVQATLNVIGGERYGSIPKELRNYALGYYGEFAAPIDPNVLDKILRDKDLERQPGIDLSKPLLDKVRKEHGAFSTDEDLLLATFYNQKTLKNFYSNLENLDLLSTYQTPLSEFIKELVKNRNIKSFNIAKGDLRISYNS